MFRWQVQPSVRHGSYLGTACFACLSDADRRCCPIKQSRTNGLTSWVFLAQSSHFNLVHECYLEQGQKVQTHKQYLQVRENRPLSQIKYVILDTETVSEVKNFQLPITIELTI